MTLASILQKGEAQREEAECAIVEEATEIAFRCNESWDGYLQRLDSVLSWRLSRTEQDGSLQYPE